MFDYDDAGHLRCLFKHGNIAEAERFAALLKEDAYFLQVDGKSNLHKIYG